MKMSCQIQATVRLPLGRKSWYSLCGRLSGCHIRISSLWRRQKAQTQFAVSEPRLFCSPARILVTVMTER